jgi:N6-L-threonylcarbamoyladenine synthase
MNSIFLQRFENIVLRFNQKEYGSKDKIKSKRFTFDSSIFPILSCQSTFQNVKKALRKFEVKSLSLVGGVAANKMLRNEFSDLASTYKKKLVIPSLEFAVIMRQ